MNEIGRFKILNWDTGFFEFVVAQIQNDTMHNDLPGILSSMKEVKLAYYSSPHPLPDNYAIENWEIYPVDQKITFYKKNLYNYPPDSNIFHFPKGDPVATLIDLALESGAYSRFKVDPNISEDRFKSLYEIWIKNSTHRENAQMVMTYNFQNQITGMITLSKNQSTGKIGLMAVSPSQRRKGIGNKLIKSAENWLIANDCETMEVITQGANSDACQFYNYSGFRVKKKEYIYHLWRKS